MRVEHSRCGHTSAAVQLGPTAAPVQPLHVLQPRLLRLLPRPPALPTIKLPTCATTTPGSSARQYMSFRPQRRPSRLMRSAEAPAAAPSEVRAKASR